MSKGIPYFYGSPKAIALTALTIFLLVAGGLFFNDFFRSTEHYKVQFDNAYYLAEGDKVYIKGLEVGEIKDIEIDKENKILMTILIGRNIKLPKGSTFTIHLELLGKGQIEIDLAETQELLNSEEIQIGHVQEPDTTGLRTLSAEERDSLVKHNPMYRLADTIMMILRKKDSTTR